MYTVAELLAAVKEMSPSELRRLSKAIQKEFSVTIEDPNKEEVYDFWQYYYMGGYTVILNEQGPNRVDVIKVMREYRGLSLKETKELVDHHLPTFVKENCEKAEAYKIRDHLEALGAVVSFESGYIFAPLPDGYSYD